MVALHFVAPSVEHLSVAATVDHSAVFEESLKVIQVQAAGDFWNEGIRAGV